MSQAIYSLDFSILDAIQEHLRTLWLDAVIPYLTMLGDAGAIWILLAIVLMLIPGKRKVGFTVAAALLIDLIICNGILKPLIARIRPYDLHTGISLLDILRPPLRRPPHSFTGRTVFGFLLWCWRH